MKLNWEKLGDELRALNYGRLHRLAAHVNAEIAARNREAEHFAHLGYTSDSPRCEICRNAAKQRSVHASD